MASLEDNTSLKDALLAIKIKANQANTDRDTLESILTSKVPGIVPGSKMSTLIDKVVNTLGNGSVIGGRNFKLAEEPNDCNQSMRSDDSYNGHILSISEDETLCLSAPNHPDRYNRINRYSPGGKLIDSIVSMGVKGTPFATVKENVFVANTGGVDRIRAYAEGVPLTAEIVFEDKDVDKTTVFEGKIVYVYKNGDMFYLTGFNADNTKARLFNIHLNGLTSANITNLDKVGICINSAKDNKYIKCGWNGEIIETIDYSALTIPTGTRLVINGLMYVSETYMKFYLYDLKSMAKISEITIDNIGGYREKQNNMCGVRNGYLYINTLYIATSGAGSTPYRPALIGLDYKTLEMIWLNHTSHQIGDSHAPRQQLSTIYSNNINRVLAIFNSYTTNDRNYSFLLKSDMKYILQNIGG